MPADFSKIGPFLIAALVVFVIYRRLRRTFGRQPLQTGRMISRIVLFGIIGSVLVPVAMRSIPMLSAAAAGIATGIALASYGAARTRFEKVDGKVFFIPHTYTGLAVSALFLGRIAYRFLIIYFGGSNPTAIGTASHDATGYSALGYGSTASMLQSPLTLGMYYVLMGYYVFYYIAVLRKAKLLGTTDGAAPPAPTIQGAD